MEQETQAALLPTGGGAACVFLAVVRAYASLQNNPDNHRNNTLMNFKKLNGYICSP
jgi:hypothetical protein